MLKHQQVPNRYGVIGAKDCRHKVPLWQSCHRCSQLLGQRLERPMLVGTGPVVEDLSEFKEGQDE